MPQFFSNDLIEPLGLNVLSSNTSANVAPDDVAWDCEIGGLPFLFATNEQFRFTRETSEFRRDRVDTERDPGEQSLDSGLWIRSQSSWHYGSGLSSAEPLEVNSDEARFRYFQGGGVNPWTPGELTLLNSTSQVLTASAGASAVYMIGVDTGVLVASGATLSYVPTVGASATVSWGGSGTITSITTDGANYYVADTTGIYRGSLPSGAGSKVWDTGQATIVRWVKSRLMATVGKAVYELTGTGPTLPTALDAGGARPAGWTWTDISEGPAAIYLSGFVGDTSTIEKIGVNATTTSVTLDVPTVVADLPRSETVNTLYSYVGTYLIIGTSKGCRVAQIASDGSITLGPLVVNAAAVDDAVAIDNYVYVTVRDKGSAGDRTYRAGLYRIDLGTNLNRNPLNFAHAADLVAPAGTTGEARQVTTAGGRLWFAVSGQGVYRQADTFVSEGWVETGRIRLGTVENKAWRDLRLLAKPGALGVVTAFANTEDGLTPSTWPEVIQADGIATDSIGKLVTASPGPASNLYVAFRLQSATNNTVTAAMIGYQIRAVPAPRKTELIQVPVMMFDREKDRQGAAYGGPGVSWTRFQALKQMEATGATVQWNDYTTGEAAEVYVERVSLTRLMAPSLGQRVNAGGVATVLLRVV